MLYKTNNPHGGDIYKEPVLLDYSANTNPFGTPEGVKKAIFDMINKMEYYPDPYCRELVEKISKTENIPEDYILCGNGATELIYSYFEAVLPKKVLEVAPTFSEYSYAAKKIDCNIVRYFLSKDKNFELDEGILDFLAQENPDVFVICNPNNPTGRLISTSLMEKILLYCHKNDILLFVDECFLDLTPIGVSMKQYLFKFSNLFILKAFTKNYGMAGARLGYCMCGDTTLLKKMSQMVQLWNVSIFAQKAGVAALCEQVFLEKARKYIAGERRWLSESLRKLGFFVCPSDANYILFYAKEDLDILLKEKGIAIRNCMNYQGLDSGWFRIAIRLHEENQKLIDTIKLICEKR